MKTISQYIKLSHSRHIFSLVFFVFLILQFGASKAMANELPWVFSGYAQSNNIGRISLNCSNTNSCGSGNYGLSLGDPYSTISGSAWSDNIGWISANSADVAGCPSGTCTPHFNYGAMTGWFKALAAGGGWDGWISLSGSGYGVMMGSPTGGNVFPLSGYAWGGNVVGWIDFQYAAVQPPPISCPTGLVRSANVTIINKGSIIGAGGSGGSGANVYSATQCSSGSDGSAGGDALGVEVPTTLDNTNGNIIAGGGGGGGGMGYFWPGACNGLRVCIPSGGLGGGGGGGGAGNVGGTGGIYGYGSFTSPWGNGSTGTAGDSTGGVGGAPSPYGSFASGGGSGGNYGQAGTGSIATGWTSSCTAANIPGAGGAPGNAVSGIGDGGISWLGGNNGSQVIGAVNANFTSSGGSADDPNAVHLTISSNTQNYNIHDHAVTAGWTSGKPIVLTINSGVVVGSISYGQPALTTGSFQCVAPTAAISAAPNPIPYGGASTLTMTSSNATTCGLGYYDASSVWHVDSTITTNTTVSQSTGALYTDRTYYFQCNNSVAATGWQPVTVVVNLPAPTASVSISSNPVPFRANPGFNLTSNNASVCYIQVYDGITADYLTTDGTANTDFTKIYLPTSGTFYHGAFTTPGTANWYRAYCYNSAWVGSGWTSKQYFTVSPAPAVNLQFQ